MERGSVELSQRESENGRSLILNGRERGEKHMFCAALSLQRVTGTEVTQGRDGLIQRRWCH